MGVAVFDLWAIALLTRFRIRHGVKGGGTPKLCPVDDCLLPEWVQHSHVSHR